MRLSSLAIIAATFLAAAIASLFAASAAVTLIEENSEYGVRQAFDTKGLTWAEVHADGLQVFLTGTAPSEAGRFLAISTAGEVVDAARVIDQMEMAATRRLTPPRFSIEILRNDAGISLIGLIPAETDREDLLEQLSRINGEDVADLLEIADYPTPSGWDKAVDYAVRSLSSLPRSKISVAADRVAITAMSDSTDEKRNLETELSRKAPDGVRVTMDISAPRPVITPFSLRFLIDADGVRFDSCSANTEEARDRILHAATEAGYSGKAACTIGLGVPSPNWARAAEMSIAALAKLGGGSVTFADADITLVAAEGTEQTSFDQIIGELENTLPEVFALHGVLPKVETEAEQSTPEFVATLSPEGLVHLRGRMSNTLSRETAISFAQARFGSGVVHSSARLDDNLPLDWPVRVLTGLDALAKLSNGAVTITPDNISISGNTGDPDANADISRLLSEKLGEAQTFDIKVTYQKKLDPVAGLPTPDECIAAIKAAQKQQKISFEPGSDTIDGGSRKTVDTIAEVLKTCGQIKLEIAGHTDSQGREVMNQQLSQARAQAVLNGLRERRVLTSTFSAVGYGETQPIGDNKTEEGREANRRIEFTLIKPKPIKETETTLESVEKTEQGDTTQQDGASQTPAQGVPDDTD
ncbi:OmpA family protein [Alisedimentitalea sp. MJ-SS2]|uniref:OmpA family protein n=1 Tax=Aliisedimentitalea sp. MJ-SS2 TaxID=3049795 RepID=UPI00290FDEEF|nr:OmpA family protein [Alisedimentitalea sp. MJ-SS2]MDU8928482.1 OmpA family protein [Alisedimentitalea sp. MJ-SS2]